MIYIFALIENNKWFKFLTHEKSHEKSHEKYHEKSAFDWQDIKIPAPDLVVDYSPTDALETGHFFRLTNFKKEEFSNDFCTEEIASASYKQFPSSDNRAYNNIKALTFNFEGEKLVGFQNIVPKKNISKKSIVFGTISLAEPKIINIHNGVIIEQDVDALYDAKGDVLYFKEISKLNQIFPGIDVLNKPASDEDLRKFFEDICDAFCTLTNKDGFSVSSIKLTNRKKITSLMNNEFASLSDNKKKERVKYYQKYTSLEKGENGKFLINNHQDVATLINVLNENFYIPHFQKEKREVKVYRKV